MTASPNLSFTFRQVPAGPFNELDRVRLKKRLELAQSILPEGSTGTIVAVWKHGAAYDVEFAELFHAVETLSVETLEPVPGGE